MYRDQLFALYDQCTVFKTDYEIHFSSDSTTPLYVSTAIQRTSSVPTDISITYERGESDPPTIVTAQLPKVLRGRVDIAKHFGVSSSNLFTDDLFSQGPTAAPTNTLYLAMSLVDPSSSSKSVYYITKLTTYVRFRRLKAMTQS